MMGRLFNLVAVVSLLACTAAATLWGWSLRHLDFAGWVALGDHYSFVWNPRGVALCGPPGLAHGPHARKAAADAVAALRNDQVWWEGCYQVRDRQPFLMVRPPEPIPDSPAEHAARHLPFGDLARPLLEALNDPDRFVVAHALIAEMSPPSIGEERWPTYWPVSGRFLGPCQSDILDVEEHEFAPRTGVEYVGFHITLSRWAYPPRTPNGITSLGEWIHPLDGDLDVGQMPRLREHWRRALDVRLASARHGTAVAATGVLPLAWLVGALSRAIRGRRRGTRGLCRRCGYDLRASPSRCPECGEGTGGSAA